MLVPSCCKLLAVVWGKEKTKRLKQRELPLGVSGKCLPDARILQRNCSPVHFPHLSPPQKKYEGLLSITIDYYWKSSHLLSLMSFACCHISVAGLTSSKVIPVMLLFSSKLPIHSVRFYLLEQLLPFVFDHANHTLKLMKSSWILWVSFHAQVAYCLKTEALVVLSIWSISWCKSNRSKRDEQYSLTFSVKQSKMFHF